MAGDPGKCDYVDVSNGAVGTEISLPEGPKAKGNAVGKRNK
jgi:hypothetical protein